MAPRHSSLLPPENAVSRPFRIAAATHPGAPEMTDDDRLAFDLLAARGIAVEALPWSREDADWSAFDRVVIRSTWDYHKHLDAFRAWARRVEADGARLWNPAAVVAWNSEKTYLRDLEAAGIPIVPTRWVARGAASRLAEELAGLAAPAVVVKPTVSASAYRTVSLRREEAAARQEEWEALLADSGAMIQPLMREVTLDGEWSFLFFRRGGRLAFSHAVRKRPAAGDFRVQSEAGGTSQAETPPPELLAQVEGLIAAAARVAPGELLYARMDGVVSRGDEAPAGTFLLMELELIEPYLFLGISPGAAERFAEAIAGAIAEIA